MATYVLWEKISETETTVEYRYASPPEPYQAFMINKVKRTMRVPEGEDSREAEKVAGYLVYKMKMSGSDQWPESGQIAS